MLRKTLSSEREMTDKQIRERLVSLIDLTSLNDDDDAPRIEALCQRALTPLGNVAAVCVYPRFVALARSTLNQLGAPDIKVATVCNFPAGDASVDQVCAEVQQSLESGADEIDLVYPYRALLAGDTSQGLELIATVADLCEGRALLKVILETGELQDPELIRQASEDAIAAGADFIKTSTGKVNVNATREAADTMLSVIAAHGGSIGLKPAGGIRTLEQALGYLELAQWWLGEEWVTPQHLRLGASGLLDDLLAQTGGAGY